MLEKEFIANVESLNKKYKTRVKQYFVNHGVYNDDIIDDTLQRAQLKAWKYINKYDDSRDFGNWYYRVVFNAAADVLKDAVKTNCGPYNPSLDAYNSWADSVYHSGENEIIDQISRKITISEIVELIEKLPQNLREPLVRRELENEDYATIAKDLGLTIPALRVRIFRAKQQLREMAPEFVM